MYVYTRCSCLRPATLLKKSLWHMCFPVNFKKFLRTSFLQNTSGGCFWSSKFKVSNFIYESITGIFQQTFKSFQSSYPAEHLGITASGPLWILRYTSFFFILWLAEEGVHSLLVSLELLITLKYGSWRDSNYYT